MPLESMFASSHMARSAVGLVLIGLILTTLRRLPEKLWGMLVSCLVFAVDIHHPDPAIEWVKAWMMTHPSVTRARRFGARTRESTSVGSRSVAHADMLPLDKPRLELEPAPGTYLYVFRGMLLWITCRRDKKEKDAVVVGYEEGLTVRLLAGSRVNFEAFLNEAHAEAARRDDAGVKVLISSFGQWKSVGRRAHRSPETLVFEGDLCRELLQDVEQFISQREW